MYNKWEVDKLSEKLENNETSNKLIDFNGISTYLGLSYGIASIGCLRSHSFSLRVFFSTKLWFQEFLANTNN